MKSAVSVFILSLFAVATHAQQFGGATLGPADTGAQVVVASQEAPPPLAQPVKLAEDQLQDWLSGKGWGAGWDPQNNRFIGIFSSGANIEASDMGDFLAIRESLYVEAELQAKAAIIEAFMTQASASNLLSIPGNPIAKQLENELREIKEAESAYDRYLEQAQSEAATLMEALDNAEADELRGVTSGDRLKALLDAAIMKLDEAYSTEAVEAEKRQRVEDLKLRLQRANETLASVEAQKKEAEKKAKELQGEVKSTTRSTIETLAEMPLFGAVTLAQAESYDDLRGNYQMAIVLAWSPSLEMEARSILMNAAGGEPKPSRKTFNEWLESLDLGVMIGTRRYLASDGTINFIGISAAEYDPDDMFSLNDAKTEAELWAKQYAILSLTGNVESYRRAERLKQNIRTEDGKTKSRVLKDMSVELSNSVEGLQISGLSVVKTSRTVHPPSGKHMLVAVASVNSDLATKATDIMKDTYATLAEVNESQAYRSGQIRGMRAAAASKKNDPAAQRAGFVDGASGVAEVYNARHEQARAEDSQSASTDGAASQQQGGQSLSGTFMDDSEVEDDF